MRLFSSRIKNVVPLSLLAVLVCTSCSQDSELDQSLEELENGDYQTLADMNMTRSGETVSRIIKSGSKHEFVYVEDGRSGELTLIWSSGYNNGLEPKSRITGDIYVDDFGNYNFHLIESRCEWDIYKQNTIKCFFTYVLVNSSGRQVGGSRTFTYTTTANVQYE